MNEVIILQGTNVGDTMRNLEIAEAHITAQAGKVIRASSVYETAPWGNTQQRSFLNRILIVKTILKPELLLETLLAIEGVMGRTRIEKWEPRIIDLDILFYNQEIYESDNLCIPHRYLHERRFTLEPLNELLPDYLHPVLKKSISELLSACEDISSVKRLSMAGQPL